LCRSGSRSNHSIVAGGRVRGSNLAVQHVSAA
jgi:hypothetical protein